MKRRYDLHTHTLYSDGTLTPGELVRRAMDRRVDVLALTDHDVTDGVAQAQQAAAQTALTLVPGVEVSATWAGRTVHIVGLRIDPANAVLQAGLAGLRAHRAARAREIGRRLEKKGIAGAYEGASALAKGPILSRTHFARFLVDAGHASDTGKAFKKFLSAGAPGAVPSRWAPLDTAIAWIRAAGGQPVLAHPGRYKLGSGKLRRLLGEFKAGGGEAIEVLSGSQTLDLGQRLARLAQEFDLLASAGSDYHGPDKPWVELGRLPALPAGCTPVWHSW